MKPRYKIIVMAFDGETQAERPEFETISDAWDYSGDLGSKWHFYPFAFVVTASGKTIADASKPLEFLAGRRLKTVKKLFNRAASLPESEGLEPDAFLDLLWCDNYYIKPTKPELKK